MSENEFNGFRPRAKLEKFTAIPNELFDEEMANISGNQFKIIMAIFRKTYGWADGVDKNGNVVYKVEDEIAQSQFEKLTGMSKNTVKSNLKKLIDKGYVVKVEDHKKGVNKAAKYRLKQRGSKVDSQKSKRGSKVDSPRVSILDSRRVSKFDSTKEMVYKEILKKIRTYLGDDLEEVSLAQAIEKIWTHWTPTTQKDLESYIEDGLGKFVIFDAMIESRDRNKTPYLNYTKGILNRYISKMKRLEIDKFDIVNVIEDRVDHSSSKEKSFAKKESRSINLL